MIIALDFDGVVVDGINECLLISWNVFNKKPISSFNNTALSEIPDEFKRIFREFRNYVRHDGHFIVSFFHELDRNINQENFNTVYSSLSEEVKLDFRNAFIDYRTQARMQYPSFWSQLHTPLINFKDIIDLGLDVRIVSGKDVESISFILNENECYIESKNIHGSMKNKELTLSNISMEAKSRGCEMVFIDDNLENILDSRKMGILSYWATWGYHSKDNLNDALRLSINLVEKKDFLNLLTLLQQKRA